MRMAGQERGQEAAERDAERLEADDEQRDAGLGGDDRADERDDCAGAHDERREGPLHRGGQLPEDA